jgi:hypothetical protein
MKAWRETKKLSGSTYHLRPQVKVYRLRISFLLLILIVYKALFIYKASHVI